MAEHVDLPLEQLGLSGVDADIVFDEAIDDVGDTGDHASLKVVIRVSRRAAHRYDAIVDVRTTFAGNVQHHVEESLCDGRSCGDAGQRADELDLAMACLNDCQPL